MACISFILAFLLAFFATCLSYKLEGSQTSYAKYPKWNLCTNGSFRLEFKTLDMNGLLVYLDDGGKYDFMELKLVGGRLKLRFNFGDGAVLLTAGQKLYDGKWHSVEVKRLGQNTLLQVDNYSQMRSVKGLHLTLGNFEQNSNFYVGGLPEEFGVRLTSLSLPSVIFEPRFRGSVRNLLFSNCGGSFKQVKMLGSEGVTTDSVEDLCAKKNPCLHGGICISKTGNYSCDCTSTDYRGPHCEIDKVPSVATFQGAQFLSYDLSHSGDSITSSSEEISLKFRTRQANGLIFYTGDGADYINVGIKEGGIIVTMNLGSGTFKQEIKPRFQNKMPVRFDDNRWHSLRITREARELTKDRGICHISIEVDSVYKRSGTTTGSFTMLSSNIFYVGGSPDTSSLAGSQLTSNFRGCLQKVVYKADSITVAVTDLARDNHQFIKKYGEVVFNKCIDLVHSQPITFALPESFIYLSSLDISKNAQIEFQFRTIEKNGLMMYSNGANNLPDFLGLEMLNGFIYLIINLGAKTLKIKASDAPVNNGIPHTLKFVYSGNGGVISVDDINKPFRLAGGNRRLDLDGYLYIGGVDNSRVAKLLPQEMWSGMLGYGYVGCMQDLIINSKPVDLINTSKTQKAIGIANYCHAMEPKCESQPCLHRGNCSEGWNRFVCDCSSTNFLGQTCDEVATTVSFDGTQHMKISMPKESRSEVEDISLRFQTQRANGLLFTTTSEKSKDHLELMLDAGRVRLDVNIGSGPKSIYAGRGLDDDRWHTVHIRRRARSLGLQVDRGPEVLGDIDGNTKVINFKNIEVGKTDKYIQNDKPKPKPQSNYAGYMQQLIFNKNHFFEMAESGAIQNIEVTAKFNKKDKLYQFPVTFKTEESYVTTRWDLHSTFTLYFIIKTTQPNALIMYISGKGGDFMAIELVNGFLRYSYNVGNGAKVLVVKTKNSISDNEWHEIAVLRHTVNKHIVRVDGTSADESVFDSNRVNFDVDGYLYIGGIAESMYSVLPQMVKSRTGYQGCIASLDLGEETVNLFDHNMDVPAVYKTDILEGCSGPSVSCKKDSCKNQGVCIQEWSTVRCDCDMTSYEGDICDKESLSYEFGAEGGLITFEYPRPYPDTSKDILALGFMTTQESAVLVRVDTGRMDDYIQLELVDGNVFVVYNMGTMDYPIGELDKKVNDGQYHVVRFKRSGPNSTIQVDDNEIQTKNPTGAQLKIFNNQAHVHIGGKRNANHAYGKIIDPFKGLISGLVFNKLRILDLCADGDPRVRIEGDVTLKLTRPQPETPSTVTPPSGSVIATPVPGGRNSGMQSTMGVRTTPKAEGVTNELIYSGGSGCHGDDEDDCSSTTRAPGPDDSLITPVVTVTTTQKPTTSTPQSTTSKEGLPKPGEVPLPEGGSGTPDCDDEENCDSSGSGIPEPSKPPPTLKVTTDDIFISTVGPVKEPQSNTTEEGLYKVEVNKSKAGAESQNNSNMSTASTTESMFITENITETSTKKTQPVITSSPPTPGVKGSSTRTPGEYVTLQETGAEQSLGGGTRAGINLGLYIGAAAGALLIILFIIYAIWRCKRKDVGSYKIDESKNFIDSKSQPQQTNGMPAKAGLTMPKFEKSKKNVKEWYV